MIRQPQTDMSPETANATLYMWRTYGIPSDVEKNWSAEGLSTAIIAALRTFVAATDSMLPTLAQSLAECAE